MVNLKCYKNRLYELARDWSYCRNCLLWIEFILLMLLLFMDDYKLISYILLGIVVVIHIGTEYLKHRINRANMLGFKFDKLLILRIAYAYLPSHFEIADLKSESIFFYKNLKKCIQIKNRDESHDYNIINKSTPEKKLLSILQENAFWNHHQFQYMYLKKRDLIIKLLSIIFVSLFVYIGFLLFSHQQFEIKSFFSEQPIKILLLFLSFGILYEIIDDMYNYKKASIEMNELDNEITRIYNQDDLTNSALSLIVKYHYIKAMCPYIDEKIYQTYGNALNKAWDLRVNSTLKEALQKIAKKLDGMKHKWAVTGGANLFIRGCKTKTYDIDIVTTRDGFLEIAKCLDIKLPKNLEKTESEDKNLKSYYMLAKIDGIDIDIMGDPEVKNNGEWECLSQWQDEIEEYDFEEVKINRTNLKFEKKTQEIIHEQKLYKLGQQCTGEKENAE